MHCKNYQSFRNQEKEFSPGSLRRHQLKYVFHFRDFASTKYQRVVLIEDIAVLITTDCEMLSCVFVTIW